MAINNVFNGVVGPMETLDEIIERKIFSNYSICTNTFSRLASIARKFCMVHEQTSSEVYLQY